MKLFFLLSFLSFISVAFASDDPRLQKPAYKLPKGVTSKDYLPDRLIIKFKEGSDPARSAIMGIDQLRSLSIKSASVRGSRPLFQLSSAEISVLKKQSKDQQGLDRIFEVQFDSKRPIEQVINEVLKNENVEYAEPSFIYRSHYIPNDSFFASSQNYLTQVKANLAWDIIKNSSNIIIGIVDSGSDLDHPDLASNIYINTADPVNGSDDDRDGYTDNNRGWDFIGLSAQDIKQDNNPDVTSDSTDHGVHVSGIASAVSDNGTGVSSIAFNARLLIVKVGADNDSRSIIHGYEGIKYAVDHGAQIINCSWGGAGGGQMGRDIIEYAVSKGCLIVAAAGNDNRDLPDYPAAYNGVLSVGSVGSNDLKSSFSNFGPTVDISAPGSGIYSTQNNRSYGRRSGTSMSAPLVASAAALVKARFPAFTMLQIGEQLRITSDNIDANNPAYSGLLGKGRLNVLRAVTEASPSIRNQKLRVIDKGNGSIPAGDTIRLFFDIKNFLAPAAGLVLNLSSSNSRVQIIDSEITIGALATLEEKTAIGPFRVFISSNTPDNEEVEFKLSYTSNGGNYRDFELFNLTVSLDYLNYAVNQVSTTMTSNGRIGFSSPDAVNGSGFEYKGKQLLYEASLMIGNAPARVSNNARNDAGGSDEDFVKRVRAKQVSSADAAFEGLSEFDDQNSSSPLNIDVRHRHVAFSGVPDDKYVIAEYEIQNKTAAALNGVYIGLFSDWDIDDNSRDITRYDEVNRMGYVYGKTEGSKYAGIKLLRNVAPPAYYPLSYQVTGDPLETGGGFTIAEKFETLSSGIKASSLGGSPANGYDVMFVLGSGPYDIPANSSVTVAFALIGADNLQDLQASAIAAERKYNSLSAPGQLPSEDLVLKQNYPNPAADRTTIEFSVPQEALTGISLYNSSGKFIREILAENLRQGSYRIDVDLTDLINGVYFYRLSYGKEQMSLKMLVVK